jgi:1-deoxy-D-xylulose-5-phosphate reductoisomerase
LNLAKRAGREGGTLPAVMNAANEIAVAAFLEKSLGFPQIWETVNHVMDAHPQNPKPTLDEIIAADAWARDEATSLLSK